MTRFDPGSFDPSTFAASWAAAWNARDIEAVLRHFTDDVTFSTPKAVDTVGQPTVTGIPAVRAYWTKALGMISSIRFTVVRTLWDARQRELSIIYDREINGRQDRALELLGFNDAGMVDRGEVFYGVIPRNS